MSRNDQHPDAHGRGSGSTTAAAAGEVADAGRDAVGGALMVNFRSGGSAR